MEKGNRGLEVFDTTVHKTNNWLNDVSCELGEESKRKSYLATRATLHALRDRLTIEGAAELGAQLPMLIRGFYYEGWDPAGKPVKERRRDEFPARVAREFSDGDPECAARAVFAVLARRITSGRYSRAVAVTGAARSA